VAQQEETIVALLGYKKNFQPFTLVKTAKVLSTMNHSHSNALRAFIASAALLGPLAVGPAFSQTSPAMTGFAITNTTNVGGRSFAWQANYTFNQTFKAQETGYPVELAVNGGNNQNPMSFRLVITASGQTIFDKAYSGLRQRSSDWATSFPISGTSRAIRAGETVVLSLTPSQQLGVEPIQIDNPNWPVKLAQATFTVNAPANGSLAWQDGTTCDRGTSCSKTVNVGAPLNFTVMP
jgi:hypothetical protein